MSMPTTGPAGPAPGEQTPEEALDQFRLMVPLLAETLSALMEVLERHEKDLRARGIPEAAIASMLVQLHGALVAQAFSGNH